MAMNGMWVTSSTGVVDPSYPQFVQDRRIVVLTGQQWLQASRLRFSAVTTPEPAPLEGLEPCSLQA